MKTKLVNQNSIPRSFLFYVKSAFIFMLMLSGITFAHWNNNKT